MLLRLVRYKHQHRPEFHFCPQARSLTRFVTRMHCPVFWQPECDSASASNKVATGSSPFDKSDEFRLCVMSIAYRHNLYFHKSLFKRSAVSPRHGQPGQQRPSQATDPSRSESIRVDRLDSFQILPLPSTDFVISVQRKRLPRHRLAFLSLAVRVSSASAGPGLAGTG